MAASMLTRFGNDLYTGEKSVDFVGLRKIWLSLGVVLMVLAVLVPFVRGGGNFLAGFNFGIEFLGGSQFQVVGAADADPTIGEEAVLSVVPDAVVHVTTVGADGVRVQTDQLTEPETQEVSAALEEGYGTSDVTSSFIGATWGADITRQALIGLGIFLGAAMLLMAIYFRTWKMSLAAIIALIHDVVFTIGVYAATGFEITPAAVIGFLTILGFSLYDTVVVFVTDLPHMTVSITTEQVMRWGIDIEELEQIARANLDEYAPDMEMQVIESKEGGKAVIVAEQDGYDAARLLMSNLFRELAPRLGGDFYVATPARDMFIALSCEPKPFLDRLSGRIEDDFRRMPYPICKNLFYVTRDGVAGTIGMGEAGGEQQSAEDAA